MRFLGLILLTACARYGAYTPTTVTAPPDAFARATRVLIGRGLTIETKDEAAGILLTKWEESEGFGDKRRVRWNLTIASGQLIIQSQCQFKLNDPGPLGEGKWDNCGNQPIERSDEAKQIANEILANGPAIPPMASGPPGMTVAPADAGVSDGSK